MTTLILAEHQDNHLDEATAKAVTAARRIGGDVHLLIAGKDCRPAAEAAARIEGVAKVLLADDDGLANRLAEPVAALILSLAGGYDVLAAPATSTAKNIMPRVAALLDVMQISDVIAVGEDGQYQRPIYAGNIIQTVASDDPKQVLTIRASAFPAAGQGGSAPIETVALPDSPRLSSFVGNELSESARPELGGARIIVSGGRALGSAENFDNVLAPLADSLGAAIGASRAAVDAGYVSNDLQVGQTGKIVAPDLYIACGISGAIQHLAGMKDSKIIVAINKDPEAPIFQIADYGLVADLFEAIPELKSEIEAKESA
ncbi:electron transfer flavoprotein subunit alpha/FixB family protein [Paracoccus sp. M683]|uniref:electron transfer flavoprotein subunit alpha/FixB family protein n=1 Tax=Paracoccus sp. M683 TaxID=2594268 RepID=UPI001180C323|nr:FAD-binding protein [Paracoccus sp. M683]TRW96591.1 electron transfer flavoprotein subunit alpha/FixB family protein [Paracoccus sp. M683]